MAMVNYTVRLIRAAKMAYTRKWTFLVAFLVVFFLSLVILVQLDWVPDTTNTSSDASPLVTAPTVTLTTTPATANQSSAFGANAAEAATSGEDPVSIQIPAIKLSATISNPDTTDVDTLDNYLLKGAVRYPTSAKLGQQGNVILFGHSSYLPIVNNLAYKTFDGIQNLKQGDLIMVSSSNTVYEYSVETVSKKSATSDAIPLTVSGSELTLSTCDSFTTKTDRFVVTATLVASHPLGS